MNAEQVSMLFERCASEEVYSLSVARFWRNKTNKLTEYAQVLANILDNYNNPLSGTSLRNIDGYMVLENDAVKISDIVSAAQSDANVPSIKHLSYSVDELVEKINDSVQNADILASSLEAVSTQASSSDMGIAQIQAKITAMTDNNGFKASVVSSILGIISNKNMNMIDKCSAITQLYAGTGLETASSSSDIMDQISNFSTSGTFTGINPVVGASIDVWDTITTAVSWQDVVNAIASPIKAAVVGIRAAWNWIKDNREKVMKAARATAEFLSISNRDVSMVDTSKTENYDFTFDNCCLRCKVSNTSEWNNIIDYLNSQGVSLTYANANRFYAPMKVGTYEFDFPFMAVYVTKDHPGYNDFDWYFTIKLKPANLGAVIPMDPQDTYSPDFDFGSTGWEYISGVASLTDESVYTYVPTNVSHFDNYFMQCLLLGKSIGYKFLDMFLHDQLDGNLNTTSFWAQVLVMCALGQGLNKSISVPLDSTLDDPTNEDFMKILSYISDQTDDIFTFDSTQTQAYAFFARVVGACIMAHTLTNQGTFIPYAYVQSIRPGKFHVRSDKENIEKVYFNTGVVVATVAAAALLTTGISMKRNLRTRAVTANLQASIYQDQLKTCLANGTPISAELQNSVYKATKKAVRLNNLTGGFASITTGLSTWSTGSAITAGTQDSVALQNLELLIKGPVS